MDQPRDEKISQAPLLALEAIRIAEESARAAERSAAGALATLERAESALKASEDRMTEITAAASSAASEATEARLRATEVATEFRSLEERVSRALHVGRVAPESAKPRPESTTAAPETKAGGTTAEFEALWDSFDRKADRIVQRLKELEARTMTVIRTPMPGGSGSVTRPTDHKPTGPRR